MKSRFLLQPKISDAPRSIASRSKRSLARRFELKYNTSPRFERQRQKRHQGQALLLAVLIMFLAALLSAGVLAIVSGNLNQTARIADKTRAIEASRAGITYANAQLSSSANGDLWRPVDVSPAPVPASNNYNFYYSQLDKVQGWANTLPANDPRYRDAAFAKFPAPDQASGDAPKFLVRVQEIPTDPANPLYDAAHAGEIKITSIGLSDDDPNVFHTAIAYKEGRRKSPMAGALRSISNWNFGPNNTPAGVPYAQVSAPLTVQTPAINVDVPVETRPNGTAAPQFSPADVPFNVVIVRKDANNNNASTVRGAVVTAVTPPTGNATTATLRLARLDNALVGGETIQKAAAIGTANTIDLLNTGTPIGFPTQNQQNGILANGSMWLQGQINLSDINKFGTKLISSGSIAIEGQQTKPVSVPTKIQTPADPPYNFGVVGDGQLFPSSSDNFPGTFQVSSGDNVERLDLINDGWNKIGAQTLGLDYSTTRNVEPFKPAKIDSPTNLARYRTLARDSTNGVYIDNRDDVEKVYNGTTQRIEAMTQQQLVEMLTSPPVQLTVPPTPPAAYMRTELAVTNADGQPLNSVSLEQRHLRGWVGPDEFLARGALVELIQSNAAGPAIRVTYDARSDANPGGPDANKTQRDNNGNLQPGVYSRILPWPKNGTLMAEGNIRIRGNIQLPPVPTDGSADLYPSLTVVSLNNIYVEGSLSVDNSTDTFNGQTVPARNRKKLMLMAKKNVIVNPTRAVLARTDAQTIATNSQPISLTGTPAAPATFVIPVADSAVFNIGDYAEVSGTYVIVPSLTPGQAPSNFVRGIITGINGNQLTIKSAETGSLYLSTPTTPIIVRSPLERRNVGTGATPGNLFYSLVDTESSINRRLIAPILRESPVRNRIIFDHLGDLRAVTPAKANEGLNVKAEDFDATILRPATPKFTAVLANKQPLTTQTDGTMVLNYKQSYVRQTDKFLRTYNNFQVANGKNTNKKEFNEIPMSPATAKPLSQLVIELKAIEEQSTGQNPEGYRYDAKLIAPTIANPVDQLKLQTTLDALPSYALAGIGLRYQPGVSFVAPPESDDNQRRQDFDTKTQTEGFTIPLATSVEYNLGGKLANLKPDTNALVLNYIGFNAGGGNADNDDALTVDSSFYQLKSAIDKSTLDSRVLDLTNFPNNNIEPLNIPTSVVLKRSFEMTGAVTTISTTGVGQNTKVDLLPAYEVRAMKVENINLVDRKVKPFSDAIQVNAYVYAQEGSWLVIPGDYFRATPPVRGIVDNQGLLVGSYIDYNGNKAFSTNGVPDPGEYILRDPNNSDSAKCADLNRNGQYDSGEIEAALRFVRYNSAPIKFYGAIVENQTAVVADVTGPSAQNGQPTLVQKGAVQDWMDKWATYNDSNVANSEVGKIAQFSFINYSYDSSLANETPQANQLRVPLTDELLYQE